MDDSTMEYAARIIGAEQARKLAEEIKRSGIRDQDFNFAFMTRLNTMQVGNPGGGMPVTPAQTPGQPATFTLAPPPPKIA